MRTYLSLILATLLALPCLTAAGPVADPENYKASPFVNDRSSLLGAELMPHLSFGLGLFFGYERNPIQLFDTTTDTVTRVVVGNHLTADLTMSLGLFEWVDLALSLPAVVFQDGAGWNDADGLPTGSFGDVRFAARARIFRTDDRLFSLALVPMLTFPTGHFLHDLSGADGITFSPTLALGISSRWVDGGLNLFYRLTQNDAVIGKLRIADQVGFRAALTAYAIPETLGFTAELTAATVAGKGFAETINSPMETALSIGWRHEPTHIALTAGGGAGIIRGFATPQMRFFIGIGWEIPREKEKKTDMDMEQETEDEEYSEEEPQTPQGATTAAEEEEPADRTGTVATEEKPKVTQLGDEEKEGKPQQADMPPPKGIAVDLKGPKKQSDDAQITQKAAADTATSPKQPAPKSGTPMAQVIYFKENSTAIVDGSRVDLEKIALLLSQNFTLKVRIEGHADRNEKAEIGIKRAQAIKLWLADRDIESTRIQTKGMGAEEPAAPSDLESDRTRNRRVVFYVLTN